jgi:predicted nucleic acid-binding protein
MSSVLVDTNILIYSYSTTEIEKRKASLGILSGLGVVLNTQVINEFIWVMQRKYSIDLKYLHQVVKNLFVSYTIGIIDRDVIDKALVITGKYGYSYWDSLILSYAIVHECSIVYTEDMQHGQIIEKKIKIINPFLEI